MTAEERYQRLMKQYSTSLLLGKGVMKEGMLRETADKYLETGHGRQPEV